MIEIPEMVYEERAVEVTKIHQVEALTQVPSPQVQFLNKLCRFVTSKAYQWIAVVL